MSDLLRIIISEIRKKELNLAFVTIFCFCDVKANMITRDSFTFVQGNQASQHNNRTILAQAQN